MISCNKELESTDAIFQETLSGSMSGDKEAAYRLGWMFFTGTNVSQNYREAACIWHEFVSDYEGHGFAESEDDKFVIAAALAYMNCCRKGIGVGADHEQAIGWAEMLAELGILESQITLSEMYQAGEGCAVDLAGAFFWLSVARLSGARIKRCKLRSLERGMSDEMLRVQHSKIFEKVSQSGKSWISQQRWLTDVLSLYPLGFLVSPRNQDQIRPSRQRTREYTVGTEIQLIEELEVLRKQCYLSKDEFASFVGVSRMTVHTWLAGGAIRRQNRQRLEQRMIQLKALVASSSWPDLSKKLASVIDDQREGRVSAIWRALGVIESVGNNSR